MARFNAITSSFLVAIVWYLWHLPHYHVDDRMGSDGFLWKYLLYTFAVSLMHTWIFRRTKGSVFIHVVFHNMTNYVALLSFTLFPALKATEIDNQVYFMLMMTMGALAAWSLRHDRR
jgi:membrane protease YdiL (CAAX protease family)